MTMESRRVTLIKFTAAAVLLAFLTLSAPAANAKPQQRNSQSENEPRWSTQRSNYFPGADQDITLPANPVQINAQQQSPKIIFPSRFQPIVGSLPRLPRYQGQESRVQHNYYPAQEFARGAITDSNANSNSNLNLNPVYQQPQQQPTTQATTPSSASSPESTTAATTLPLLGSGLQNTVTTLPTPPPAAGDNREIRFLIHKPGDEEIIKRALYEDSLTSNEQISFLQGPTIKLQQKQKVYLPPKRKTVVYVFIKEPEIETKVEMVEPSPETAQDQPQVFIFYQKNNRNKESKEHFLPKAKSAVTSASVNLGLTNNSKHLNLNKAPSASNQVSQAVDPPPIGCNSNFGSKN